MDLGPRVQRCAGSCGPDSPRDDELVDDRRELAADDDALVAEEGEDSSDVGDDGAEEASGDDLDG